MTQQTTHLWKQVQEWLDALDFAPSQARLAERVGVARSAVSAWKLGKAYPTPENLATLARVMNPAHAEAVYERLLDATLRDQGYVPMPEEGGGAHAGSAAPSEVPAPSPADQLGSRRASRERKIEHAPAARTVNREPGLTKARREHDEATEAVPEDPTGMEPI
jgi:transcriptional regulator with XRE-family HTH domain